jgi:hypothetical protein
MEERKKLTGKAKGGVVDDDKELNQELSAVQRLLGKYAYTLDKHKRYKSEKYSGKEDEVVSPRRSYEEKTVPMPGDFKGNTIKTPFGDRYKDEYKLYNIPEVREEDIPFKKHLRYYQRGGKARGVKITEKYSIAPEAKNPKLSKAEEAAFQRGIRQTKWFQQFREKYGESPNLNDSSYNYRAAWKAGVRPQDYAHDPEMQHWASVTPSGESLKSKSHPTAWMEDYMQVTGRDPHDPAQMSPEQIEGMKRALRYRYSNQ